MSPKSFLELGVKSWSEERPVLVSAPQARGEGLPSAGSQGPKDPSSHSSKADPPRLTCQAGQSKKVHVLHLQVHLPKHPEFLPQGGGQLLQSVLGAGVLRPQEQQEPGEAVGAGVRGLQLQPAQGAVKEQGVRVGAGSSQRLVVAALGNEKRATTSGSTLRLVKRQSAAGVSAGDSKPESSPLHADLPSHHSDWITRGSLTPRLWTGTGSKLGHANIMRACVCVCGVQLRLRHGWVFAQMELQNVFEY